MPSVPQPVHTSGTLGARARDERGIALIVTLLIMLFLVGIGSSLVVVTTTETAITANHRTGQESLYAADAGVERIMQDLLLVANWNDILGGSKTSGFVESGTTVSLPDNTLVDLVKVTSSLQQATDTLDIWGSNDPTWRLYAYGQVENFLPPNMIDSPSYLAVWIGDDPSETDGNPLVDTNGVLTVHAEAYGPLGATKVIEATVARTDSTEIERGYIAQRGQEELNQRARKAAIQNPGGQLTRMQMGLGGNLTVQ